MKLNRKQLRKMILNEIALNESDFAGAMPGLEIFRDSMWGRPDNWRYVADSSIAQVIQPLLQRGKDPNEILDSVLPFQKEQVSNVIQKLSGDMTQPSTHSAQPEAPQSNREIYALISAPYEGGTVISADSIEELREEINLYTSSGYSKLEAIFYADVIEGSLI